MEALFVETVGRLSNRVIELEINMKDMRGSDPTYSNSNSHSTTSFTTSAPTFSTSSSSSSLGVVRQSTARQKVKFFHIKHQ